MPLRQWIRGLNRRTNELYYKCTSRPHYMKAYARMVDRAVEPCQEVIHLGCGPKWLGEVCTVPLDGKRVWAVDPDEPALARNPSPDKLVAFGESVPLADGQVGAIVCEHVVEHIEQPGQVLQEAHRLLAPGGRFVFTTPNLLSYAGLATHFTPFWFHQWYLKILHRDAPVEPEPPYPTCFRMNSMGKVRRLAAAHGFEVEELYMGVDHPTYTAPFPVIHQMAVLYHLVLVHVPLLAPLRMTITASLRKPQEQGDAASD